MLTRKIFDNVHCACCNGYFGAFWIIFSQILFKFLILNLSASPDMMHFVHTSSIMRAYGVRVELEVIEKLYTSTTFSKMAGRRMHTPHPNPLDPPLAISYKNRQKSLSYFSHSATLILFFFTKR